jgi:putative nucleotidyltransferase with HDIG domain
VPRAGIAPPRPASASGNVLKRIARHEVRLGMYVHALHGGWLSHPFWRGGFLLTKADDLKAIRGSGIEGVTIDLRRGCKPATKKAAPPASSEPFSPQRRAEDMRLAVRVAEEARKLVVAVFDNVRLGKPVELESTETVVQSIIQSLGRNRSMLLGVIRLRAKDEYTYFHSVAVCTLMVNLAREMGLPEDRVQRKGLAGLLHDIGKATVSEAILNKPGKLTDAEFAEVRHHARRGYDLLVKAGDVPGLALDVCLHHHEKIDGTGYPDRLKGDEISLAARMGAICDIYDALTSIRPYKGASSPVAAIAMMKSWPGHLDPDLLFTFMKSIGVFPIGMPVRLSSGQLAIVRGNGRRSSRARLTIFYDLNTRSFLEPHDLHLMDGDATDLVVAEADPEALGITGWAEVRDGLLASLHPVADQPV